MNGDLVDAHVHLLPPRLAARVRRVFDEHLPGQLAYATPDADAVLDDLAGAGVGAAWVLPYAHAPGVAEWLVPATAEHVATLAVAHPDVDLVLGATVHPGDPAGATAVHDAVHKHGARVLKLHCAVGGFAGDDRRLDPVLALCSALSLPIVLHVGKHAAGTSAAPDLGEVDRVATRFPDLPLIVAHTALPAIEATLALLERHPNLHADLTPVVAATPELSDEQLIRFGDRLLFGSDAPNTGLRVGDAIARWRDRPLPADTRSAILGGNARRLTAAVRT
ncbi:MAG: amidohydrolase family protein [Nitriliruptor sp.]